MTRDVPDITRQFTCDNPHDGLDLLGLFKHGAIALAQSFLGCPYACFRVVGCIDCLALQTMRIGRREMAQIAESRHQRDCGEKVDAA